VNSDIEQHRDARSAPCHGGRRAEDLIVARVPREKYTEVFLDEGEVVVFAVVKDLARQKCPRLICPEPLPLLDADPDHPFKNISAGRNAGSPAP